MTRRLLPHRMVRLSGQLASLLILAGAVVLPTLAQTADEWVLKRDVSLRKKAGDAEAVLVDLKAQSRLKRTGNRQAAWIEVKTDNGLLGWVHMFDLQSAPAGAAGSQTASALRSVGSLASGGDKGKAVTTVAGIRGLDATDLAKAAPDPNAVAAAERLRVSDVQAREFAGRAKLIAREVAELPAPAPAGPNNATDSTKP